MSKVSQQIKARRQQHRQDHFTKADKSFNGQGQQARRAGKMSNYQAQGNQGAADFNFDQHGKGHISGQEFKHLRDSGSSRSEIMSAVNANGGELGKHAQKKVDKWEKESADHKQRYTDHFNKIGGDKAGKMIADYEKNTKGMDPDKAWQALEGGRYFDPKSDGERYKKLTAESDPSPATSNASATSNAPAANAKELAQTYKTGDNSNSQTVDSSINKNVNQNNDINTDIQGDNNYVNNRQDNSIRTYGGDTRTFNYQSSGNSAMDTPVSAATMAGYFAPNDSHGAQAARLDRNITMANDYAKDNMDVSHITQGAIKGAEQNAYINPAALDARIRARETASFAKSKVNEVNLWGDPDKYSWGKPQTPDAIEVPDFEKIGKSYTDY